MSNTDIVGVIGVQGSGKTMLQTVLGIRTRDKEIDNGNSNYCIYSNYALKDVPYKPVSTLYDLERMRNGVFLGDELWLWIFSRTSQSKINAQINKIIMLNRKRGISILYTSQRLKNVDVMLRSVTNYFYFPFLVKEGGEFFVNAHCFNENMRFIGDIGLKKPVNYYGQFYDTNEEIGKIDEDKSLLQRGIDLEDKFTSACKKLSFSFVDLLYNSGKDTSWNFDVLAYKNNKCFCFDVKSITKKRITMVKRGSEIHKQIKNAYDHGAKPFFAFPMRDKKRLTDPNYWYVYPLSYNCNIVKLNSYPTYNKTVKESFLLKDFVKMIQEDKI